MSDPSRFFNEGRFTRRTALRYGGIAGAALAGATGAGRLLRATTAGAAVLRSPDSLPDPTRPAGAASDALPFDHVVVVMMENHSFDNLLGALSRSGQPKAHGLRFDAAGNARNSNPGVGGHGRVRSFALPTTAQAPSVTQTWNATHEQINGGKMNGFVKSVGNDEPMGYWTEEVLPFAYSFARSFTLNNRWFCSAPCQTYPNRRFLMAATAYGDIATDNESLKDPPPPNGTIFDRMQTYGVSWRNYFTDLPQTAIIPSIIEKYPSNLASDRAVLRRLQDRQPALRQLRRPRVRRAHRHRRPALGAAAARADHRPAEHDRRRRGVRTGHVLRRVLGLRSRRRRAQLARLAAHAADLHLRRARRLLRPRQARPPRSPPTTSRRASNRPTFPGGYDLYGPRVPGIVASPYCKPNSVTDVLHDHTSVLATIEAKWNLPALTNRDANAHTVTDFLDLKHPPALLEPPVIVKPPAPSPSP